MTKSISPDEAAKRDLLKDIECYTCGEPPSPLALLGAPIIEGWSTGVRRRGKEFVLVVKGDVRRHPEFADGDPVATAAVQWFDRKCKFVRTPTMLYALGDPSGDEIPIDGVDL